MVPLMFIVQSIRLSSSITQYRFVALNVTVENKQQQQNLKNKQKRIFVEVVSIIVS